MNGIQGSNTSNGSAMPVTAFTLETFFISALYVAIAVISVFGNILVILAVYTNRRLQTTSNYLLVALAVPDFFQGAVSLPLRLVEVLKAEWDHQSFCLASIHVSTLFGGASNLHILLIAIERFISICWPYFYFSWITTKCALLGVGVTWLSMFIFSLLPVMGSGCKGARKSRYFLSVSSISHPGVHLISVRICPCHSHNHCYFPQYVHPASEPGSCEAN